jgi:hypothetical protein
LIPQFEEFLNISHSLLLIGFCPSFNKQFWLTTLILSLVIKQKPFVDISRIKRKESIRTTKHGPKELLQAQPGTTASSCRPTPDIVRKEVGSRRMWFGNQCPYYDKA